jgi:hypothetical protein
MDSECNLKQTKTRNQRRRGQSKDKERKAASKAKRRKKKCDIFNMTSFIFNKDEALKNN